MMVSSKVTHQAMRKIDHEESEIHRISHSSLGDIHKIFQPPELFGISEIEFNLEPQRVQFDKLLVVEG